MREQLEVTVPSTRSAAPHHPTTSALELCIENCPWASHGNGNGHGVERKWELLHRNGRELELKTHSHRALRYTLLWSCGQLAKHQTTQ